MHPATDDDTTIEIRALRDISAEEELFLSYGPPSGTTEHRREWLKLKYRFDCVCHSCVNNLSIDNSDDD